MIGFTLFLLSVIRATAHGAEPIEVFVSILPQKTFVERIGGESVNVSVIVQPGANPATYEPKPRQMVALTKAKAYFAIGVPFEAVWLNRISAANPGMMVIHTEEGIEKRTMEDHLHGEKGAGEHHGVKDPHIWLSPRLVKAQSRNILNGLLRIDPARAASYEKNYKNFIAEISDLDNEIKRIFSGKGGRRVFMTFHPAWGYFAQAYGLEQVAVEMEGKEPGPVDLRKLVHYARERGIKVIFVQPQFSTKSAEAVAKAIEGGVVFANPLALDWADNLKKVATEFEAALK
ncbi:MAG: zinc ABC transporter substrate-binding protein [Deltaproteobacteria bacterium]|nr:zinc ABC transporter substrate-binding protein [Deltaproteobacteria bacterium]